MAKQYRGRRREPLRRIAKTVDGMKTELRDLDTPRDKTTARLIIGPVFTIYRNLYQAIQDEVMREMGTSWNSEMARFIDQLVLEIDNEEYTERR